MQRSFPSRRFARRASRGAWAPLRNPADVIFVEDSFEIFEGDQQRDFRMQIDSTVGGLDRRWAPNDPLARYLPSGAMVSTDETEALLSIAPVRMQREVCSAVAEEVLARRAELQLLLAHNVSERAHMKGYATSLAAYVNEDRAIQVASRFAKTVAPAFMLLLDLSSTPGVLLRASDSRVEIVTEHIGSRCELRAALVLFTGCVMAIDRGITFPALACDIEEQAENGGFLAERDGFGDDIFVSGRMACLNLANGGTILAGSLLGEIWEAIKPLCAQFCSAGELALVDDIVSGASPLPSERDEPDGEVRTPLKPVLELATIIRERRRGDITVRPACVSWDGATLAIGTKSRTVYARVSLEQFESFAKAFDRGRLDKPITAYADAPSRSRVAFTSSPLGLYDLAEIPMNEAENRLVRIGKASSLELVTEDVAPRRTLRVSKRIISSIAAAAMFAATAAVAFTGLRQPDLAPGHAGSNLALASTVPSAAASVLANKHSASPLGKPTAAKHAGNASAPHAISTPSPSSPRVVHSNPDAGSGSLPSESPTTPAPASTPTPTSRPTPAPTPTRTYSSSAPVISGSISCGVSTSSLSFTVSTESGAPQITKILVQYSGAQQQPSPPPSYPSTAYQGNANAAVTVTSNHRWTVSVQDQSGRSPTVAYFAEKNRCN